MPISIIIIFKGHALQFMVEKHGLTFCEVDVSHNPIRKSIYLILQTCQISLKFLMLLKTTHYKYYQR